MFSSDYYTALVFYTDMYPTASFTHIIYKILYYKMYCLFVYIVSLVYSKYKATLVVKYNSYTQLTSWVTTAIIQQETAQGRAAAIELFIKVASECLKHNDAQSCVLITCALNSCCVRHDRLKLSWEQVSSKVIGYNFKYLCVLPMISVMVENVL